MVALAVLVVGLGGRLPLSGQVNGLLREVYSGIGNSTLDALTNAATFPDHPTSSNLLTARFEAPTNAGDSYGQRVRALLLPPANGNYVFWLCSDDQSALYLSPDENPANKRLICVEPVYNASRDWTNTLRRTNATFWFPGMNPNLPANVSSNTVGTITLEAGKRYYIEALMKEGGGDDNLAVRWQLPSGAFEAPVPASRFLVTGVTPPIPPVIQAQPASAVVPERSPATFSVTASSFAPASYQWLRNDTNIPGATGPSYAIQSVALADNGARFRCVIWSGLGTNVSVEALLGVVADTVPPALYAVAAEGSTSVVVTFSEEVTQLSATNRLNYALDGGALVSSAAFLGSNNRTVLLTTTALTLGATYTLTVNGIVDRAAAANTIVPNSQRSFTVQAYTPFNVGYASLDGGLVPIAGGYQLTAAGSDIGGTSDQFLFGYQRLTGDFDLQVRVESLNLTDVWARAGLMARETLDTNSVFAAAFATPTISGCNFQSRATAGATAAASGYFPVNFPNTWLRLKRASSNFTGFASADGLSWAPLGAVTMSAASTMYVGLAASSHTAALTTVARFQDFGNSSGSISSVLPPAWESPGSSSRRTGLILSEIMYHPARRDDGRNLEYVEIMNTQAFPEDIGGYRLSGAIDYVFPTNTVIAAGSLLVVAKSPADLIAVYGLSTVLGGYVGSLQNNSGTVRLRNHLGAVLLEAEYSGQSPWPAAADGAGHSLILKRPSFGERDPQAWAASDRVGGSPGFIDPVTSEPAQNVLINEFLAHTDDPELDYLELYNHSNQSVDISGCSLSDDPSTNKFQIPAGTVLPKQGFVYYTQNQLGFMLDAGGETLLFRNAAGTRVLDAVRFEPQANGVSSGRTPDGAPDFQSLATKTPGTSNGAALARPVVISEIMYHPISGDEDDEYVELYNRGTTPVNLGGWKFVAGIEFKFPTNATLSAGGYLVVARNAARLLSNYPGLNSGNTLGDYQGALSNSGERVALAMPEDLVTTNAHGPVTNLVYIVVNEVTYTDGGRWGRWSDGGGSSLELIDARGDNRLASNWADSDEALKSSWTTVEWTGLLDWGQTNSSLPNINALQLFMQDAGECLVDDVEVIGPAGTNLVANAGFESGLAGWAVQGNHNDSFVETNTAFSGSSSLHVKATGRGDTGANRVRAALTVPLSPNQTATLRAKVRWLKGHPELLLRLRGNYLEAIGTMAVPQALGTPGAPNSRRQANAGPALFQVTHLPVLPAAGENVVVTARAHDPDGLAALTLNYRVDPATNLTVLAMVDDGTGGDAVAGDGLYSATVPGAPAGTMVAFHLRATDAAPSAAASAFPNDAPTRECLIRFGESQPAGNFGTYRIWFTQATYSTWATREKNSNKPLDATFVYGNQRVVYNIGTLYSGSPWHTPGYNGPTNNLCDYVVTFPEDDLFLGTTDFVLATVGNLGSDNTCQREQMAFWIARQLGIPYNHRRYVHVLANGVKRGLIFEDAQQPNSDMAEQWFPDDPNGDLHKIEDWFEFSDSGDSRLYNVDATLGDFVTTGGAKKLARYRWNWRKRAVQGSANNFTNLFSLVNAVNDTNATYAASVAAVMDYEQWMRVFAVEHIVGNWDSYGYSRGKNMYAYRPTAGKWQFMLWDIDFVLGLGHNATYSLFAVGEPVINRMFTNVPYNAPFLRAYWRALDDAANGPLINANADPILDAKYAALIANGVSVGSPTSTKTYLLDRRNYIQSQLATVASPFAITSNGGNDFATSNNLVTLSGTAPVSVKDIRVNGITYPATWTSVSNWTVRVPVFAATNTLAVQGFDYAGRPVALGSDAITVTLATQVPEPERKVVINEILYHPAASGSGFIELLNTATNTSFDLSRWRLDGVDFVFPDGTVLLPGAFATVVENRTAFTSAFGSAMPVAGEYRGQLQHGGETLRLMKPGPTSDLDVVIDEVRYDDDRPWPGAADGTGSSLQLVDTAQDNGRVGNWVATGTNVIPDTQWQYAAVTGAALRSLLYLYLDSPGDVYIDDVKLVAGSIPEVGTNLVTNGGFEAPLAGTWNVSTNLTNSAISSTVAHAGAASLHLISTSPGASQSTAIWQVTAPIVTNTTYTLSFWYLPSTNGSNLTIRLSVSPAVSTTLVVQPFPLTGTLAATPGTTNAAITNLPPFAPLWINEVQPDNVNGMADHLGDLDPWAEIYNAGTNTVSLAGYYLTDNYTNLTSWPFPPFASIAPGQFLTVWLDGEQQETISSEWHASFRLNPSAGSVALVRSFTNQTLVMDYVNYAGVVPSRSYGSYPDGAPTDRRDFYWATPGASNNPAFPPVSVVINEWMASNTNFLRDPVDNQYQDWIELFNASTNDINLSGYTLTDALSTPGKWAIPPGTIIPKQGYLLVWADNQTNQNGLTADLHAGFQLSRSGEEIGLFAPDGSLSSSVVFGTQFDDVSQGRWPNGQNGPSYFMSTPTPRAANFTVQTNAPPVLMELAELNATEGVPFSVTFTATDTDLPGQSLTFSLGANAPAGATINPSTGELRWTPREDQGPGVYTFDVHVTDNGVPPFSDTKSITVNVAELNGVPILAAIGNKIVDEGTPLTFVASASDLDVPVQLLAYSLEVGAPAGASIHPVTGAFTWTPSESQGPGVYTATVRVIDNGVPPLTDSETITITVNEVNAQPILAAISAKSVNQGNLLSFTNQTIDTDIPVQMMTYTLDPVAPPGAAVDPVTGVFTWVPSPDQAPSTNTLSVRVTDNGVPPRTHAQSFTVLVVPALVITNVTASGGGNVVVRWQSHAGKVYRLQGKDSLSLTNWTTLGSDVTATGSLTSRTNNPGPGTNRIYRIWQLN